ncbi:MAG: NADH-quinone oxidoreductase subunit NuoG [Acidimicrobiia bacterium]|nr:NADH-quinone oxidoreductase subunit NuoG [Acidimicrobiia bacterium]MBT8249909.1 NADH-quinone oxidoreductase subunit NuoG [Acidimicrobiia bacterium]NNL28078.1 NADH-quinone oxidoreductase subunit NuoG [Acidimicrobiia bacterium]NNL47131.1 NADH-quinone oxidoreductase subunit NuoG [Acidimicrobiia bacterium]
MSERVTITVDGIPLEVDAGELLIKAAEDNGTYIPRFCWHPRMKPVGMCRMCLVEVEGPRGILLTTSCNMPVSDGMVVHTESETVKKAQEGILEFLLINHPLDCPVCDRGGECPLQDQTLSHGPGESRFVEEKRHFEKPIPISDLVLLDRERCILCARCTRFSDEVSGDPLIEFQSRGNNTQVLTFPDEPFASYFSGNTVQICPVGALTSKPYRFRARPWDLEKTESTCPHCSVGCSIEVHTSQNEVIRYQGVDNDDVNWGWLCDKGRYSFESVNSAERLDTPLIRNASGQLEPASWPDAMEAAATGLASIVEAHGGNSVAGIGGARGSNESAYAFGKFMRTIIGTNHLDAQLGDGLDPHFLVGSTPRGVINDLDTAKTIVLWGPDLKEELPVLYLRVRHAAQQGAKLIVIHPRRTGLDDRATFKVVYKPGEGPALLNKLVEGDPGLAEVRAAINEGPVVGLVGRTGLTEDPRLAEAVAAFLRELPKATLMPLARRSNVYGALDMGVSPRLLPGRVSSASESGKAALREHWGSLPDDFGRDTIGIIDGLADGHLKGLVMMGSDPVRDVPSGNRAAEALSRAEFVVAIDTFLNDSAAAADVVFPALGFTEQEGTVTNLEGRVQKVTQAAPGPGQARPDWSILEDLAHRMGGSIGATSVNVLFKEIVTVAPAYRGLTWVDLEFGEGRDGLVMPLEEGDQPIQYVAVDPGLAPTKAPLALHSARTLYDDGVHTRFGPSLERLVGAPMAYLHPDDAARLGIPDGGEVDVETVQGSARVQVGFDPSLAPGTVFVPFNQGIGQNLGSAVEVKLEVVS